MLKKKSIKRKLILLITFMIFLIVNEAYAGILDTKLFTGTIALFQDASVGICIAAPIISAFLIGFFEIRKGMAEANEQPVWKKRVLAVIISLIIVEAASSITAISSYYK